MDSDALIRLTRAYAIGLRLVTDRPPPLARGRTRKPGAAAPPQSVRWWVCGMMNSAIRNATAGTIIG